MARKRKYSSLLELLQGADEQDVLRAMVGVMMQEVMQEEAGRHVGADPHERSEARGRDIGTATSRGQ
jgi:transposase-like protein